MGFLFANLLRDQKEFERVDIGCKTFSTKFVFNFADFGGNNYT